MNLHRKYCILSVLCSAFFTISPTNLLAQTQEVNFISSNTPKLSQTATELSQNVLAMLTLIKEYEKINQIASFKIARITKPVSLVKETDNVNASNVIEARMNEEFMITEERDKWYRIMTKDNREGWLPEGDIQIITKQPVDNGSNIKQNSKSESNAVLLQIARYRTKVEELYSAAGSLIKETEEKYNKLSNEDKLNLKVDYQLFNGYKEKIEKYRNYAVRYIQPYDKIIATSTISGPVVSNSGDRFKGIVSADLGTSRYNNVNSSSTTSRRLSFDGNYQIDKATNLNFLANHQNELIQSAFINNTIEAGITHQFADKFALGTNVGYNNYTDKTSDINSFGLTHAQVNAQFTPTNKIRFFGNVNVQSKKFNASGDNDYQGVALMLGTNLIQSSGNILKIQINSNNQTSKKNYLQFHQVTPQFSYTIKKSPERSVILGIDYDLLTFVVDNNVNDYQKFRFNFLTRNNSRNKGLTKKFDLIYKQYPNSPGQDYLRIGYTYESREGTASDKKTSVSSLSYILTLVTQRKNNFLKDYLDIRWDKSVTRPRSYSNSNICMKFWNNFEKMLNDTTAVPEHLMDFYSEFGPYFRNNSDGNVRITDLKAGLILGGHLYFRFNSNAFISNGNSARCGLALNTNIRVYNGTILLGGSYERSFILCKVANYNTTSGDITYGKNLLRKPSSIQFSIDYRQPISDNWDLHFNLNTYEIRTDATTETSINPVDKKSSLRVTGGLIYRFAI
jgi:hypothetical protein